MPTAPRKPAYEQSNNYLKLKPNPILDKHGQNNKKQPNLIICKIIYVPTNLR